MRSAVAVAVLVVLLLGAIPAVADLQNVIVGGSVRIRGDYFSFGTQNGVHDNSLSVVEQRTRLNVRADFTEDVSAFIELDSYDVWGDGFRSNYVNGVDSRPIGTSTAGNSLDAQMYQAYIEAKNMFGTNLRARVGRQEIKLGNGWLVGTNDVMAFYYGLSFDALRLTYATEQFSVDAIASKLAEGSPTQEDGDTDFYAVYGSYLGIQDVTVDAYWMFIRDAAVAPASCDTHTFGLRGAGKIGAFDFEAEAANQLVEREATQNSDVWGGNLEVGYTFDCALKPRVYLGGAYFEGDDKDLAFNRLFASKKYGLVLDNESNLTNMWLVRGGAIAYPVDNLKLTTAVGYFQANQVRALSATDVSRKPLGMEADIRAEYSYTKDLVFGAGYAHVFVFEGLKDGNYIPNNGLTVAQLTGGIDYVYVETKIAF